MREYFQWPADKRPKIFGMTASPIWNPKDAAESLATLERNLDAKVIAVRDHVDELADHSPKPHEVSVLSTLDQIVVCSCHCVPDYRGIQSTANIDKHIQIYLS